jgi:F0F1-type ATP synthase assembly protein I
VSEQPTSLNNKPALDEWTPEPFAQRKSQNLGQGDFLKAGILHLIFGGAGGALLGHLTGKALKFNPYSVILTRQIGTLIGVSITAFHIWQKKEAQALDVHDTLKQYKDFEDFTPTNEQLTQDNQMLKRITAHQQHKIEAHNGASPHIQAGAQVEQAPMLHSEQEASR